MNRLRLPLLVPFGLCTALAAQTEKRDVEFFERREFHAQAPAVGTLAPDLVLVSLEGRPVALSSLRGRVVVLIKAGFTCPMFRRAAAGLRQLQNMYAGSRDVTFLVVEQKEPHAGRTAFEDVKQPATFAERCALAERMRDELEVTMPIYVDGMDDASRALFSDLPSPAFVIDREGRIADKLPWADPEPLGNAITRLLRDEKPVVAPNVFQGGLAEREAVYRRAALCDSKVLRAAWVMNALAVHKDLAADAESSARLALARVALFGSRIRASRLQQIEAAEAAANLAWKDDPLRLLAARVELVEAKESTGSLVAWRALAAGLSPTVEPRVREWITQQRDRLEEPLHCFAPESREEVERYLESPPTGYDPNRGVTSHYQTVTVDLVRVRFEEDVALLVRDSERTSKVRGEVALRFDRKNGPRWPEVGSERWVLLAEYRFASVVYLEKPIVSER